MSPEELAAYREWNIDRESYRKEARELLQAEHPEVFR